MRADEETVALLASETMAAAAARRDTTMFDRRGETILISRLRISSYE